MRMISAALRASEKQGFSSRLAAAPKWAWWLLALAYIAVRSWSVDGSGVFGNFGDSDDATRLIQVRELLAFGHWFDTTTMKIGGDAGMLSHWSRLIDLPIATLIKTFSLVMPVAEAERLAHAVWPLTLVGSLLWVLYRTTASVAGETAGRLAMLLAVFTPSAWYQFAVGRIDHHNAMIAATVSAALLMWSYPHRKDVWRIAGVLSGLALAIGYEALAPAVALGVLATVWSLCDDRTAKGAGAFALALTATFTLAFFAIVAPSRWMDIRCDAISLNMVALVACGGAGLLVAVWPGRSWTMSARLAATATCAITGMAIFGMLEPKCLAGPKGQLPPLLMKIWLDNVAENGSIARDFLNHDFEQSFGLLLYYFIVLWAQIHLLRKNLLQKNRAPADMFLLAALSAFVALACWQYKYTSYASFLGVAPMAIAISRLGGVGEISANTVRLAAIVFLNQAVLAMASGTLDNVAGKPNALTEQMREDARTCSKSKAIGDLAVLPPGLVASHIDVGAFVAALTHHRALSAPYHRIADAIIANDRIFSARDPSVAAQILTQQNVDYVVICNGLDDPAASSPMWKDTLRANLVNAKAPSFLVPVPLTNPDAIYHVWKVDRTALNPQPLAAAASAP